MKKRKCGKLTDDDLNVINGKNEQLLGFLQKRYGLAKDRAEEELSTWEKTMTKDREHSKHR